jgi:hypothetical protein
MSEKKSLSKGTVALAAVAMVALIALSAISYVYMQQNSALQDKDKQIADLQSQSTTPKLIIVPDFQYMDDRSDSHSFFLHVTGYVVNVGGAKANNCTIHVNAVQNGNVTAIDTTATIKSVEAGAYEAIDLRFPYTGQALVAYSSYLEWTT